MNFILALHQGAAPLHICGPRSLPARPVLRRLQRCQTPAALTERTESTAPDIQASHDAKPLLAQPLSGAAALAAFGLVAADILVPGAPHLLAPLDLGIEQFAVSHWPASGSARAAANALSNAPITAALVGSAASAVQLGMRNPRAAAQRVGLALTVFTVPGWGISPKDVPLVDALKHIAHRSRPGFGFTHSSTFSFPSGHTFMAVYFLGVFLLLLQPDGGARRKLSGLWALAGVTAVGRVLCDVHWFSDTLAGALLALSLISFNLVVLDRLDSSSQGCSSKNQDESFNDQPADQQER